MYKSVGVIGAGSFGTVIANVIAEKHPVWLYTRSATTCAKMARSRTHLGRPLLDKVSVTDDLASLIQECMVLFPVVPSETFRSTIRQMARYLSTEHIVIHGSKGFDLGSKEERLYHAKSLLRKEDVCTLSKVVESESPVVRVGCLSGPNLAHEIADGKPAATIIASRFEEVIHIGQRVLRNSRFLVYGSRDLIGVELCGVLKNVMAMACGVIEGLGLGDNAKALLISRGVLDMVRLGRLLGGSTEAFMGLAGIGDVIVSSYSRLSRNFQAGEWLAQGKNIQDIRHLMDDTIEGIRTVKIVVKLARQYKVRFLIAEILDKIMESQMTIEEAGQLLMKLPFQYDTYGVFEP